MCVETTSSQPTKCRKLRCTHYQKSKNSLLRYLGAKRFQNWIFPTHICIYHLKRNHRDTLSLIPTRDYVYAYKRLPFGLASVLAIFQRIMDGILQGLAGVCTYLDDILITGKTTEEHIKNLNAVLTRLREAGMRLKKEKCQFSLQKIEYLGHVISSQGL